MIKRKQREKIMTCIYQRLLLDKELDEIFEDNIEIGTDQEAINYIIEVTVSALNNEEEYINIIDSKLKDWSFDRLGYIEQSILLLACDEIINKRVERNIALNEAVEICKKYCDEDTFKLINGVLDKL